MAGAGILAGIRASAHGQHGQPLRRVRGGAVGACALHFTDGRLDRSRLPPPPPPHNMQTYMDKACGAAAQDGADAASSWCPPLIINAWNEWSEGAYLEPDQQFGYGKLKALQSVFG